VQVLIDDRIHLTNTEDKGITENKKPEPDPPADAMVRVSSSRFGAQG
jgi:hypothetical protein